MSSNKVNMYDVDSHIAEIYDTFWALKGGCIISAARELRHGVHRHGVEPARWHTTGSIPTQAKRSRAILPC